ncbi:MAG: HupE/UreJ family protein [Betaproteobacteria bacterium]
MNASGGSRVLRALCISVLLGVLAMHAALAHKGSDAYLEVQQLSAVATRSAGGPGAALDPVREYRFGLSVALRDLDQVVAVDADGDARITWAELKNATPQLVQLFDQTVLLETGLAGQQPVPRSDMSGTRPATSCALHWQADGLERRGDGTYLRAFAIARCANSEALRLRYRLFRAQDANHRLLVAGRIGGVDLLMTASPQQTAALPLRDALQPGATTDVRANTGRLATLQGYFLLGMHHLLLGYDHLAFLLALVLPLRLRLWQRRWQPGLESREQTGVATPANAGWLALLRTITAFTIGHSVTLFLATLGLTQASPSWVEPVIAVSIAVTAAHNLRPWPGLRIEWLALGFGMVHGYGFAGLLQEAAAPDGLLGWALVGFNLGVEAGQLLAVASWILVAQWVMRRSWYVPVVVRGGSVLLIGLATAWFWQRVA